MIIYTMFYEMTITRRAGQPDFAEPDIHQYYARVVDLNRQGVLFGAPNFETRSLKITFERGEVDTVRKAFGDWGDITYKASPK